MKRHRQHPTVHLLCSVCLLPDRIVRLTVMFLPRSVPHCGVWLLVCGRANTQFISPLVAREIVIRCSTSGQKEGHPLVVMLWRKAAGVRRAHTCKWRFLRGGGVGKKLGTCVCCAVHCSSGLTAALLRFCGEAEVIHDRTLESGE